MSQALDTAYACGWSLATTLMTCVVVFRSGDDDFGIMTSAEYDGDPEIVVHEFDPLGLNGLRTRPHGGGSPHGFSQPPIFLAFLRVALFLRRREGLTLPHGDPRATESFITILIVIGIPLCLDRRSDHLRVATSTGIPKAPPGQPA